MIKRLFVSIDMPGDIKDRLLFECENKFSASDWRFMKKENLHITLAFIGSVDEEKVYEISGAVENVALKKRKFPIKIESISLGPPSGERTRVWADIAGEKELSDLAGEIKSALIDQGIDSLKKDYKRFSPHVTLAKKRTLMKRLKNDDAVSIAVQEDFTAESIDLMESVLSRDGSEYSKLNSFLLANES